MVIATKCGLHCTPGRQTHDARPATLRRECEESLRRLETDRVELLYLHAPDKNVPVAESAGELKRLMDEGKTRAVGASNVSLAELEEFAAECPLGAFQPPYNMLMRQIENDTLPWCREHGVAVLVYWPLMKGLLAGKIGAIKYLAPTTAGTSIRCSWAKNGRRTTIWSIGSARSPRRRAIPWPNWSSIGRFTNPASPRRCAAPSGRTKFANAPAAADGSFRPIISPRSTKRSPIAAPPIRGCRCEGRGLGIRD